MKDNNILDLESRRNIYNYILRFPGISFSEIGKSLGVNKNNLDYHLIILKKHGLIDATSEDGYIRYYPTKLDDRNAQFVSKILAKSYPYETETRALSIFKHYIPGRKERKALGLIKRPVPHKIISFLMIDDSPLMEISRYLTKHWTTTSFHLKKLIKANIIEVVSNGNRSIYRIKDKEYILKLWFLYWAWKKQVNEDGKLEYSIDYSGIDEAEKFFFNFFPIPFRA